MKRSAKIAMASVLVGCAVLLLALYWHPQKRDVPDKLLGQWHTADVNYADRYFEIRHMSISFTVGGGTANTGSIKELKSVQEGHRTLYTLVYELDGTNNEMSFYYETVKQGVGVIRFKNQQIVIWIKSESI
ncbi:MAG TPA: hypothetical protein VGH37_00280 [Candidatus Acidoferrum sp.]|jgi:hypothetical protein